MYVCGGGEEKRKAEGVNGWWGKKKRKKKVGNKREGRKIKEIKRKIKRGKKELFE